jgi:hypothetical protein
VKWCRLFGSSGHLESALPVERTQSVIGVATSRLANENPQNCAAF